ncbi:MAG TPA: lipopolysaccharide kinase InaA family protein [Kiritimatiellia bacterium]|nr:lipopolysaccharide kinase InaA family protein [Kiritimatiellia bacterium]HRZ11420.1 lipopolysaccharide kinase InaA family protein [Kiritimatiellia bacterium]HSA17029.1 lipopolysaccharide kinase InaA family protein [Kiritimatiellia bacterium]
MKLSPAPRVRPSRYSGHLDPDFWEPGLPEKMESLPALLAEGETVQVGGRSRVVRLVLFRKRRPVEAAVKSFGRASLLKNLSDRLLGTKARRSWLAAEHLRERGVGTPPPVGYLDRWRGLRLLESYYFSEYVQGLTSFRNELIRLYRHEPECARLMALLETVARAVRALHEAGVVHGDLGNQNILLRRAGAGEWRDVQFVDLNRARIRGALSNRARARDISRITLPSDFLRVFIEMYFAAPPPPAFLRWERFYRRLFAWHTASRSWRHPLRARRERRAARPPETTYPAEPDIWIWDERSGQAISAMRPPDRRHYYPAGNAWRTAAAVARAAFPVRRQYNRLIAECYARPVDLKRRFGVALHPEEDTVEREAALLEELGPIPVMLRFYRHRGPAHWALVARTARALKERGHPVAAALVQDRASVRDPARWADFADQALGQVDGIADWVEIGHAVNRVKWGVWDWREYGRMAQAVAERAPRYPGLKFMGPAGIDFEYPSVLALLDQAPAGFRFHALSHHLYVDRRGAPENTQAGFDLEKKCALARAIAAASPACEDRLIISEVNWPVQGQGVWSPVGSPHVSPGPRHGDPSVGEQEYADFMIRYLAAAVCSGMAERVYWWRLVARGYGLVDDTDPANWRPRPAYEQLRFFLKQVGGGKFMRRLEAPPGERRLALETEAGRSVVIAWTHGAVREIARPEGCTAALDALGREQAGPGDVVRLGGSPVFLLDAGPAREG